MGHTTIGIQGSRFTINGRLTYEEIQGAKAAARGLLMNARFIQGVFDDANGRERYARFGFETYDPEENTDRLIEALPEWYRYGLRAFTVGFQGGGPCFTIPNEKIDNNPFGEDGSTLDEAYAGRMDRLIRAADNHGMAVIVSILYGAQAKRLVDDRAVVRAVRTASNFLREGGYTNVILEVANEYDIPDFQAHPVVREPEGMVGLLEMARKESGGLPVGVSGVGNSAEERIARASDVILVHANGCTRQKYYNLIRQVRAWEPDKPIVCNEDSQALGQMEVAYQTGTSWGYYNNMTKQEPPADWGVTPGEDTFFARRMAEGIGISLPPIPYEERFYLQGLEPCMTADGKRWIRLASLYPERIDFVRFYRNGKLFYTAYDEPFSVHYLANWRQGPITVREDDREWSAEIFLRDGTIVVKTNRL